MTIPTYANKFVGTMSSIDVTLTFRHEWQALEPAFGSDGSLVPKLHSEVVAAVTIPHALLEPLISALMKHRNEWIRAETGVVPKEV